jgi:hypothetical protein
MNTGIIYFIQPTELIGTNRYKIGCSENTELDRVKKGYKKGTRYIFIIECNNPYVLEKNIKKIFNEKFKLIAGYEYFEGDEKIMKDEFLKLATKYSNEKVDINDSTIIINNYKDKEIISKYILIEKKREDKISVNYVRIKEFFEDLPIPVTKFINERERIIIYEKITNESYDKKIIELHEKLEEDEDKICDYLNAYKNIIIQIYNKYFNEEDNIFDYDCSSKSLCEFLGYYDTNYRFLTLEYIKYIIQYNREEYKYFEIIRENNNKYSGILMYEDRDPVFISNIDLDYNYIMENYSIGGNYESYFYSNCKSYINENDSIKEHLEGHLENWKFFNISKYSYYRLYQDNSSEFKKIIYPLIIILSIKDEFSEYITELIRNNNSMLSYYIDDKNRISKNLKKYKNLKKFIKKCL